jgi:hypothetical protein
MRIEATRPSRDDEVTPVCACPAFSVAREEREDPTPLCATPMPVEPREPDPNIRFGEWLVRRGLITATDLFAALHDAFVSSFRVGDVLVMRGLMERRQVEEEARAFRAFSAF